MRATAPLAALALAAACAAGVEGPLPDSTVGPGYAEGGGRFSSGTDLTVRATAMQNGSKVAVCAAWSADFVNTQSEHHIRPVLETGVLQLNGRNIIQGFDIFAMAPSRAALDTARSSCVLTGADWRPGDGPEAVEVRFIPLVVSADPEEGIEQRFRPRY